MPFAIREQEGSMSGPAGELLSDFGLNNSSSHQAPSTFVTHSVSTALMPPK